MGEGKGEGCQPPPGEDCQCVRAGLAMWIVELKTGVEHGQRKMAKVRARLSIFFAPCVFANYGWVGGKIGPSWNRMIARENGISCPKWGASAAVRWKGRTSMLPDGGALNRLVRHRDRQAFAELVRQNDTSGFMKQRAGKWVRAMRMTLRRRFFACFGRSHRRWAGNRIWPAGW